MKNRVLNLRLVVAFIIILLACGHFALPGTAVGAVYNVDINSGDDGNDGIALPWKTLHYAFGVTSPVVDNDTINVQAGTYNADFGEDSSQLVINKNGLIVFAFGTVVIESSSLSMATWQTGVDIVADQVKLQGLEIRGFPGSGIRIDGSRNMVDNCMIHDNSGNGIFIDTVGGENTIQNNCDIHHNASYGIYVGSALNVIDFCHVHDNNASGIFIDGFNASGSDTQIMNNCEIFNNFLNGIEIYDSPNNLIKGNNNSINAGIYDNGSASTGNGISISGTAATNNDIIDNRIYYTGISSNVQSTGIYINGSVAATNIDILGNSIEAHTISGVWITDCDVAVKGNKFFNNTNGIWVDAVAGVPSPTIWNNLFYSGLTPAMDYGIHLTINGGDIANLLTIYHNTIDGARVDGIVIDYLGGGAASPEVFYNIISNSGINGINNNGGAPSVQYNNVYGFVSADYNNIPGAPGAGAISADPGYVDVLVYDYRLSSTSFCIDTIPGTASDPVPDDLDGKSRPQPAGGSFDMGCFEYSAPQTWYVDIDHSGAADNPAPANGSDPSAPWKTLHYAISQIASGDTLVVMSGTYSTATGETDNNLFINQDNLTILGDDSQGTVPVLSGTGAAFWIDGLDVQGGENVSIRHLEIRNFIASGIHMGGAKFSTVESCLLHDNRRGVTIESGPAGDSLSNVIQNNLIYGSPLIMDYGIYLITAAAEDVETEIYHNTIDGGAVDGIYIDTVSTITSPRIEFNIISGFTSGYAINGTGVNPAIDFNNAWNNANDYVFGGIGPNSINVPPEYVNAPAGDYHLQSASGCIDAIGVPAVPPPHPLNIDLDGVTRPQGAGYDTGCYEYLSVVPSYTVIFSAGPGGSISGEMSQSVPEGGNCSPVTAVAANGYRFTGWRGGYTGTANPLTIRNVRSDLSVSADFEPVTFSVTFSAGPGGSITGETSQIVRERSNCTSVTAVAADGYRFIGWSGDYNGTANPLTIRNVRSDLSVSANFELIEYTVTFAAGTGGRISGDVFQTVPAGGNASAVFAEAATGYSFTGWSGSYTGTANPLTLTNVTANQQLRANFEIKTYIVSAEAGAGGSLDGNVNQSVAHGSDATPILAVPDTGYHFTGWSGDYAGMENPLTLPSVTSAQRITANFEINTYQISFDAGIGGSITGGASQVVEHGKSSSPVTAKADPGYEFSGWSGSYAGTANPLKIEDITSDMSVTAYFSVNRTPLIPELISPIGKALIDPVRVVLTAGAFSDPEADAHIESNWQIRRLGQPDPFYSESSFMDLTEHAPGVMLDSGVRFEWRVGYVDSGSRLAAWSEWESFIAGKAVADRNIPPVLPGFEMKDYRMISFIQWPVDYSFLNVVEIQTGPDITLDDFKIGTYDPVTGDYARYPDLDIEPGRAYWILARYGMKLAMEGVLVSTDQDYQLNLAYNEKTGNGWNMIGSPNSAYYQWNDVEIIETDANGSVVFGPLPVSMLADDNEYIDRRIWRWTAGEYVSEGSGAYLIQPYEGAWVRSKKKGIALRFPVASQAGLFEMAVLNGTKVIGGIFDRMLPATAQAVSDDSPPMPMGYAKTEAGSDPGCFIQVISGKTK